MDSVDGFKLGLGGHMSSSHGISGAIEHRSKYELLATRMQAMEERLGDLRDSITRTDVTFSNSMTRYQSGLENIEKMLKLFCAAIIVVSVAQLFF